MAGRDTVHIQAQIGVEATKGVAVPANIILPATSFQTGIRPEVSPFRPEGQKYITTAPLDREWTEASISGRPSYTDLAYLLASIMCVPDSEAVDDSDAYEHVYTLNRAEPDAIRTFSVEQGDPSAWSAGQVKAHKFNYGTVTELGLEWRRTAEPTVSGRLMGRQLQTMSQTMTAGTMLDAVPILSGDISLYLDTSLANIGTTQLTDVSRVQWRLGNRFNPRWAINRDEASWSRHTEMPPDLTFQLLMGADAAGMSPLASMRTDSTVFIRLEAESAVEVDDGVPYSLVIDMATKVTATEEFNDDEGTYAIGWTFTATPALAGGVPCIIKLVNAITSI